MAVVRRVVWLAYKQNIGKMSPENWRTPAFNKINNLEPFKKFIWRENYQILHLLPSKLIY